MCKYIGDRRVNSARCPKVTFMDILFLVTGNLSSDLYCWKFQTDSWVLNLVTPEATAFEQFPHIRLYNKYTFPSYASIKIPNGYIANIKLFLIVFPWNK